MLTDSKIKGLKPKENSYYVWVDTGTRGTGRLGIKVYPSGRKVFVYKYHDAGRRKFTTLGDYPQVSLHEAGNMARKEAENPTGTAAAAESFATLQTLIDDYIAHQKAAGVRGYEKTENRLKQLVASQHINAELPAREITSEAIRHALSEFIQRGAVAGSNKARGVLHAAFNYGLFADNDPASVGNEKRYGIQSNPVGVIPKQKGAEKALDRYLSWGEVSRLLKLLRVTDTECPMNPNFARLLLLCLFTGGQRPWELLANTRDNFNAEDKLLTVPPELSKTKNFHVIPLSASAITIIETQIALYPESSFLFPADTEAGHLLSAELSKQVRKFCLREDFTAFTPRDIRRTFKTLAGELGITLEMRDIVQNHTRPGVSRKHYDRYDYLKEKRKTIAAWNKKISQL